MRDPTTFLRQEYEDLVRQELDWKLRVLGGPSAPWCTVDGKRVLMFCSNNYLGLSNHPKLKAAAVDAINTHGAGSGSVRPIAGNMDLHVELERRLARFKDAEASLVYQTGFAANAGLIPQLAGKGDVIISDELNHGSIIDGVRLSAAERKVYKHSDTGDLARVLEEAERAAPQFRRILIITDGVFSMDGDIAPLDKVASLGAEHGAMVYVDDAHGEGVLGEGGRGIVSHFRLGRDKVHVEMGTFSKAFGVVGGHVSGSRDLVNFAYNKSRTWLLSGSHPPGVAAACLAAVDVLEKEPQHVQRLWENTRYFKKAMKDLGFDLGRSETPITPVMVGESGKAKKLSSRLFEIGVFALPIVYPMVAQGKARIRTIMNAALSKEDLDFAIGAFEKAGRELELIPARKAA
ncbi:MAG: aminotransferase class I/II-fold pyridoxal phosphate-dependent enzyme [Nitrososphaerota archaeon]|nr:aminotransferase class I/II-fold pyridoxal phosphate-dependent enzyme [Nitrososphaerota archaeon]MDG6968408.1 aminotransferase class I/II-fold pyridoxal phosphate-dependent enzyme [Nitrososphaerota archaeon]MDG6973712.1 aminotransferase class I/II-fold pyridoxal phosphate-dependent enzyme [Nitrososphaerota archaeon]MDG6975296.1 aminotransferase class I/II-fold pyridoxal phosphate-dependent enzyme [Nitrososphaerota archaeon]